MTVDMPEAATPVSPSVPPSQTALERPWGARCTVPRLPSLLPAPTVSLQTADLAGVRGWDAAPVTPGSPKDPCPICTCSLSIGRTHGLPCGHLYHRECIRKHAEHNGGDAGGDCPYCRAAFPFESSPFQDLKRVAPAPSQESQWYLPTRSSQIMHRTHTARMAVAAAMERARAAAMAVPASPAPVQA